MASRVTAPVTPWLSPAITVTATPRVLDACVPPLAEGQRVVLHAKPEYWTGRGSLQFRAKEIRPVGLGTLLEQLVALDRVVKAQPLLENDFSC